MRTFTPAAHEGANRAGTRAVIIVQETSLLAEWSPLANSRFRPVSESPLSEKFRLGRERPSKREGYPSRSSLTPPCGTTAVGSSGTIHQTGQAWVMRGRNKG
jgi:hypothetical protein